jgi:hypothetical protein
MKGRHRLGRTALPPLLLNPALERGGAYPLLRLEERRREVKERQIELFDFGTGDPREPTDPKIRQALIDGVPEVSRYPSTPGKKSLREAFAGWMERDGGPARDRLQRGDLPRSSGLPAPLARAARRRLRYARLSSLRARHPLRRRGTNAGQVEGWG